MSAGLPSLRIVRVVVHGLVGSGHDCATREFFGRRVFVEAEMNLRAQAKWSSGRRRRAHAGIIHRRGPADRHSRIQQGENR